MSASTTSSCGTSVRCSAISSSTSPTTTSGEPTSRWTRTHRSRGPSKRLPAARSSPSRTSAAYTITTSGAPLTIALSAPTACGRSAATARGVHTGPSKGLSTPIQHLNCRIDGRRTGRPRVQQSGSRALATRKAHGRTLLQHDGVSGRDRARSSWSVPAAASRSPLATRWVKPAWRRQRFRAGRSTSERVRISSPSADVDDERGCVADQNLKTRPTLVLMMIGSNRAGRSGRGSHGDLP